LHDSATSQPPLVAARHCVPASFFPSVGQAAELPVQVSAWSQTPTAGRHVVPVPVYPFCGHTVEDPVHFSSASQTSATGRQTVALEAAFVKSHEPATHWSTLHGLPSLHPAHTAPPVPQLDDVWFAGVKHVDVPLFQQPVQHEPE
jgi:hypothetical protein